ncbi:hypothetical protein [Halorarum salinum]|uniref:Uncharacterized protein n=1 Tax=Halorarum salinum TaxID=2743089 RepID=A0A7D5QC09_9EURY|nr:hypothetical protein [Halobaculum salinum]QLG62978.1 hypothetical protein HUG12_15055 [Halobaculum salinum]
MGSRPVRARERPREPAPTRRRGPEGPRGRTAGLGTVVRSVTAESNAALYGGEGFPPSAEVYERLGADTVSAGPVLPDAGATVHEELRG